MDLVAVGSSPIFRNQIARALEVEPDSLRWAQSVTMAEESIAKGETADIFVLSPEVKEPDALGLAEYLGKVAPSTAVVVVRDGPPNGLLPLAMRAGIRDVVDLSRGGGELVEALEKAATWAQSLKSLQVQESPQGAGTGAGEIVAVFSSKGGTGKTFLACNLAAALAEIDQGPVALVDIDFAMGDVFSYFGSAPTLHYQDFSAIGDGVSADKIRAAGVEVAEDVIAYGTRPDPYSDPPSGQATARVLRALKQVYPHVVVDASAEYSDPALATFDLAGTLCLVASLDIVSVRHLSKVIETLDSIGVPKERFRIVLNRADSKVGLASEDVQRVMKFDVDSMLPSSRAVPTSLNRGVPVYLDEPRAPISRAISDLAGRIAGPEEGQHDGRHRRFRRKKD